MTTTKKTSYKRKLSAIERYNIVINESTISYNVEAILEGRGTLDPEKWQHAVNIAAQANPGMRVRLKNVLGFSKWVDSGINPEVKVIETPNWDGYSEKGIESLKQKINVFENEPVCDVLLIPGDPARVMVRALHAVSDARGLVHFILDIMRVLRNEEPIGSMSTLTDLDVRLMHQDKVKVVKQEPVESIPAMPPAKDIPEHLHYVWRRVRIDKKLANMLPKMAIFLAKQARSHIDGEVVFTVPVDFRSLRVEANSTANLTGYLKIKVDPQDSTRDVMKRINQEVRDHGDCYNPGVAKLVPWMPINFLKGQLEKDFKNVLYSPSKGLPTGGIVSLGLFKPEEWSCPEFQVESIIGIPGSVGKLNVLIHNYKDNTQILFSAPEAYNSEGQLDALIEAFRDEFDVAENADTRKQKQNADNVEASPVEAKAEAETEEASA
ncbi:hypothetical protein TDB9533_00964 [Thalassocella blandensis]|nr:hypothetical protein TDB9533_00964 [Thalassocella blandensis]